MARPLSAVAAATVVASLAAAAPAQAHSLIQLVGDEALYVSQDATSLNTLTIRMVGGEIEFRDPTVDGGIQIGSCRPGDIAADGNPIQAFCPASGVARLRVDLADREDSATIDAGLPVDLRGGTGADSLTTGAAADRVDAGEGNDRVATGAGADRVTAGPGVDVVDAGPGDDAVDVRDGLGDTVSCGEGNDQVVADTLDNVALDCETVDRLVTAAPPESAQIAADKTAPKVDAGAVTAQRLGTRGVVRVAATSSERGTVGASGFVDIGRLRLPLGSASAPVAVGGAGAELKIRLTRSQVRSARRALKRKRKVIVRLSVVATDLAGNSAARRAPKIRLK